MDDQTKKKEETMSKILFDINIFVQDYLFFIHSPAIKNKKVTGFNLTNGSRIFFKDNRMTKENSKKLSNYYQKKGISNAK